MNEIIGHALHSTETPDVVDNARYFWRGANDYVELRPGEVPPPEWIEVDVYMTAPEDDAFTDEALVVVPVHPDANGMRERRGWDGVASRPAPPPKPTTPAASRPSSARCSVRVDRGAARPREPGSRRTRRSGSARASPAEDGDSDPAPSASAAPRSPAGIARARTDSIARSAPSSGRDDEAAKLRTVYTNLLVDLIAERILRGEEARR